MFETASKITGAELEVMGALWEAGRPLTVSCVREAMALRSGWRGDTAKTLLRRLCAKGAVGQEKREVYYYFPLISREEYGRYSTRHLIDRLYSGSARDMLAALVKSEELTPGDIDELRAVLDGGGEEK